MNCVGVCYPQEFHLIFTREMGDDDWQLDQMLDIFKRQLEKRERARGSTVNKGKPSPQKPKQREEGTTHALLTVPPAPTVRENNHQGIAKQYLMY